MGILDSLSGKRPKSEKAEKKDGPSRAQGGRSDPKRAEGGASGRELKTAAFAEGCFWGVQDLFDRIRGVKETMAGYSGGHTENPTYKDVCTDETGHAETVLVRYDPDEITYEELLEVFFLSHDPTEVDRQGPDEGTQYRSVIFYYDEEQKKLAEEARSKYQKGYARPIATQIVPASEFYKAEEYHQKYDERNGFSCHIIDFGKIGHLLKEKDMGKKH